ncbi:hypothetical protein LXL04_002220 [Taraxacum kok-saghyz]
MVGNRIGGRKSRNRWSQVSEQAETRTNTSRLSLGAVAAASLGAVAAASGLLKASPATKGEERGFWSTSAENVFPPADLEPCLPARRLETTIEVEMIRNLRGKDKKMKITYGNSNMKEKPPYVRMTKIPITDGYPIPESELIGATALKFYKKEQGATALKAEKQGKQTTTKQRRTNQETPQPLMTTGLYNSEGGATPIRY